MNNGYLQTVRLLLDVAPAVFAGGRFAMKGGTALNLFVQDMPRMSVDIDVVYVPHGQARNAALQSIADDLALVKAQLEAQGLQATLRKNRDGTDAKLFVFDGTSEVKVEVNFVFRGTALPPENRPLTAPAQARFAASVTVPVLAVPELYGSKLVAALDRQHPRDLFDAMLMLQRFGLPEDFLDCFVLYLAGHDRPVHEVLFPNEQDIDVLFANEFAGMTTQPVTLHELKATRAQLFQALPRALTARQRSFLLSMVRAEPDWALLPFAHASELPALRWKLMNLNRLKKNPAKFRHQFDELKAKLEE